MIDKNAQERKKQAAGANREQFDRLTVGNRASRSAMLTAINMFISIMVTCSVVSKVSCGQNVRISTFLIETPIKLYYIIHIQQLIAFMAIYSKHTHTHILNKFICVIFVKNIYFKYHKACLCILGPNTFNK